MPKILTLKQLLAKKYKYWENLPEKILQSLGALVDGFVMIVWAESGSGKSTFLMQLLAVLMNYGKVLYIGLEEGHRATMQGLAAESFRLELHQGKIAFADAGMIYNEALIVLRRRKSAKIVVVDSIQYWEISYQQYKALKEEFPKKVFIFISHCNGKLPDGKTANKIRYDSDIKIYIEGFIAFVKSRLGGNKPYVIYEEGAKEYWGKDYKKKSSGLKTVKIRRMTPEQKENIEVIAERTKDPNPTVKPSPLKPLTSKSQENEQL